MTGMGGLLIYIRVLCQWMGRVTMLKMLWNLALPDKNPCWHQPSLGPKIFFQHYPRVPWRSHQREKWKPGLAMSIAGQSSPLSPKPRPSCLQEHTWGRLGVGGRPHLFRWGTLGTSGESLSESKPFPLRPLRSRSGSLFWVCQPVSALPLGHFPQDLLRLGTELGKLGFFLLHSLLWIPSIVVEVNYGLHWENGQHFPRRTLQLFLPLWNG